MLRAGAPRSLCFARKNAFRQSTQRQFATSVGVAPSVGGTQNPTEYCRDLLRKHDRDSYLTAQFYPNEVRPAAYAVKAFATELAMVQDAVSNSLIGQMRIQFWRGAIKSIQDTTAPQQPVALALQEAISRYSIQPYHLRRMIDARETELEATTYMTTDDLLAHAESTSSTLHYILLSLFSLQSDSLAHAASHLGAAQTIATLLRSLPYHLTKGRMVIPATITAKHGVSQEDVFRKGPAAKGVEDAVYDFAVLANDHLLTARKMFSEESAETKRRAMPVFLAAIPVSNYLQRLEGSNFDAFDPKLQLRENVRLPWQIWSSNWKATI